MVVKPREPLPIPSNTNIFQNKLSNIFNPIIDSNNTRLLTEYYRILS